MHAVVFFALFGAAFSLAIPSAPTQQGYVITGQFNCVEFNCADLELELSRIVADPTLPKNATSILLKALIPSTPFGSMNQDLYSAYANSTRMYYLLATTPNSGVGVFWGIKISNDVSSAQIMFSNKFQFPAADGNVLGLHCALNGSLILVFGKGAVAFIDPTKGTLAPIGNMLTAAYANGAVTGATAYDADTGRVFAIITNQFSGDWALSTLPTSTGVPTAFKLTFKPRSEKEGTEVIMNAMYCPATKKVVLTLAAISANLGFDQVWQVDPATGDATTIFYDLMQEGTGYGFQCTAGNKDCDSKQTLAYDAARGRLYFQAHAYESSDDEIGVTVVVYTEMTGKFNYINQAAGIYFGFQAFQYVSVVA